MARKKIFDGNGSKLKQGSTVIGGIVRFTTIPGWTRTEIDDTELANIEVETVVLGNLKKYNQVGFDLKFANSNEFNALEGNKEWTIQFSDGSTLVFWGALQSLGDASAENNSGVIRSCTMTLTNLNASGVETKPTLNIADGPTPSGSAPASGAA